MKSVIVSGKWLNERLGTEAEVYTGSKFSEEKEYAICSDRSVQDSNGHEVASDFITDEVADELGLIL